MKAFKESRSLGGPGAGPARKASKTRARPAPSSPPAPVPAKPAEPESVDDDGSGDGEGWEGVDRGVADVRLADLEGQALTPEVVDDLMTTTAGAKPRKAKRASRKK